MENEAHNRRKISRKSQSSTSTRKFFACQTSMFRHYYSQIAKDGIQIRVYKVSKDRVTQFSPFTSVKV